MGQGLWVARLLISARTAAKVAHRHNLDVEEVRDAVQCVVGLPFTWDVDELRGRRVIVKVRVRGTECDVVLYDAGDPLGDVYHLGSAYRVR